MEQQAGMNEWRVSKQLYGWRRSEVGRLDLRDGGWADHVDCKSSMSLVFIAAELTSHWSVLSRGQI